MSIEKLNAVQFSDLNQIATLVKSEHYGGMMLNTYNHPELGTITTIQGGSYDYLLIKS